MYARAGLTLLTLQKGDQSAAEDHYAYLLGQRSRMIETISSVDRLLGLLAHTMADLNQATEHLVNSLAFCRKAGYRPELAWTCCDYADTLLQRNEWRNYQPGISGRSRYLSGLLDVLIRQPTNHKYVP